MRGVWATGRIRDIERAVMAGPDGVPEPVLMRRAAFGVAREAARLLAGPDGSGPATLAGRGRPAGVAGRRVVLLAGAGGNGGDALWAGAFLRRRGAGVTAVLLSPEHAHAAGLAGLRRAGGRVVEASDPAAARAVSSAELVIDGIVGLAGRGPLREPAARLLAGVRAPVLAVDTPSGVDPDTGEVRGPAVTAAATVTFGCLRPVHVLAPYRCGRVTVVDIGLGDALGTPDLSVLEPADAAALWPLPGPADDKYTQGVPGIAAGSAGYPGAAVLCTGAAVLAKSGLVRYAGSAADAVNARWPEAVVSGSITDAGQVQAWGVGPGLGTGSAGRAVLRHVLAAGVPVVADADAVTMLGADPSLADLRDPDTPLLLTPHDREFARITGAEPGADRVAAVVAAARRLNATILLKGHSTVIADPAGQVLVHPSTNSWAATAGSGDVLTGLCTALLAARIAPLRAAAAATLVHGVAAAHAAGEPGVPVPSSALMTAVPAAIRTILAATR